MHRVYNYVLQHVHTHTHTLCAKLHKTTQHHTTQRTQRIMDAITAEFTSQSHGEPPSLDACSLSYDTKKATNVWISIVLDKILYVDDKQSRFEAVLWLFESWLDDRVSCLFVCMNVFLWCSEYVGMHDHIEYVVL